MKNEKVTERWVITNQPPAVWDRECDVLVLGGGGSGAFAAIEADEAGAKVIVIEASDTMRGETAWCGGGFAGCQTKMQAANGIADDPELFVKDWLKAGGELNDPDILRAVIYLSGSTIDKLQDIEAQFEMHMEAPGWSGHTVPRTHWSLPLGDGAGVMIALQNYVHQKGIEVLYETTATKLFREAGGRVVGAAAQDKTGQTVNFKAKKAVVLATAGPSADFNRLVKYMPFFKEALKKAKNFTTLSYPPNTGNIFEEALALHADWNNFAPYYTAASVPTGKMLREGTPEGQMLFIPFIAPEGLIAVTLDGKRFCNEESTVDILDERVWRDIPGMSYVSILDARILKKPMTNLFLKTSRYDIDQLYAEGIEGVGKADTIEELAKQLGMDPAVLKNTVDRWNSQAAAGEDPDFARGSLGEGIVEPPFYAITAFPNMAMSKGGLKVNPECQVLDIYQKPIPGLYAAGDIASGQLQGSALIHVAGAGCAIALNMGRISGMNGAKETPWS